MSLQQSLNEGVEGPTVFENFLADVSNDLRASESPVNLSEKIRTFSVPAGTSFSVYGLGLFSLLDEIHNSEHTPE